MMKDSQVRIRAFRACEDRESSQRFVDGHARVLAAHGVKKVTSLNSDWIKNPAVFVILVEEKQSGKVYGGARIHAAGGTQRLPIEDATGYMDEKVYRIVEKMAVNGTGELCGLWNSMEVAGLGIGSFFSTRAGLTILDQIGLKSIFALCAPYTVRWVERLGLRVVKEVGNEGTFYYPKLDLLATVALLEDTFLLENTRPSERDKMMALRKQPCQLVSENPPGKRVEVCIEYDLKVRGADLSEWKNPKMPPIKITSDEQPAM